MDYLFVDFNELLLIHLKELDCTANSLNSFSGTPEKLLNNVALKWSVENFQAIFNSKFPELLNEIAGDLSHDQFYTYKICMAVISGHVDTNYVSPIVCSR